MFCLLFLRDLVRVNTTLLVLFYMKQFKCQSFFPLFKSLGYLIVVCLFNKKCAAAQAKNKAKKLLVL